jgi:hypothetical protein
MRVAAVSGWGKLGAAIYYGLASSAVQMSNKVGIPIGCSNLYQQNYYNLSPSQLSGRKPLRPRRSITSRYLPGSSTRSGVSPGPARNSKTDES